MNKKDTKKTGTITFGNKTAVTVGGYPADNKQSGCGGYACATIPILMFGQDKGTDDLGIIDRSVDAKGKSVKVWDPNRKKFVLVDSRLQKLAEAILPLFKIEKCFLHRGARLVSLVFEEGGHAGKFCSYTKDSVAAESEGEWRSGTLIQKVADPGQKVPRLKLSCCVEFPAKDIKSLILLMEICKQHQDIKMAGRLN